MTGEPCRAPQEWRTDGGAWSDWPAAQYRACHSIHASIQPGARRFQRTV